MKFSIIVPVYNVYNYIDRCLLSIQKQTYKNFEVIIVNDGSPDKSQEIIDKYTKSDKRFKSYLKKNGGLSDARNYGVHYATGDYLIFVDSDDFIDESLLKKLSSVITKKHYDIIRYSAATVLDDGTILRKGHISEEHNDDLYKNISEIVNNYYVEPVWLYAYNHSFFIKNKITFPKGMIHEDFGTTLIALSLAKSLHILNFIGYYYVQRENSIMNSASYEKTIKKTKDFYQHHLNNREKIKKDKIGKMLLNYSASCTICKCRGLNNKDLDEYVSAIKKDHIIDDIYGNSLKRKLKKIYLKLNLKRYIISLRGRD